MLRWFDEFTEVDYARSGNPANDEVTIPAGIFHDSTLEQSHKPRLHATWPPYLHLVCKLSNPLPLGPLPDFSHTMEPQLRSLGMPTTLKRGVVTMDQDFRICRKGDTLTPEQARMLVCCQGMPPTACPPDTNPRRKCLDVPWPPSRLCS